MESLTVAVAQTAPRLGDVVANLRDIERVMAEAARRGARLVLFPELALTGYGLRDAVSAVALRSESSRLRELAELSREAALVAGFVEEGSHGTFYNSALVAIGGRAVTIHRKRHLPTYGVFDEGRFFTPGSGLAIFELEGWRLGVLICEEAWYPKTVQDLIAAGAESLLILAAGPGRGVAGVERWQTQDSWLELVRYYARTYAAPAFLANRTGVEEGLFFGGCSAVFDPSGRITAQAPSFDETLLTGVASRQTVRRARMRNPGRPVEPFPALDPQLFPILAPLLAEPRFNAGADSQVPPVGLQVGPGGETSGRGRSHGRPRAGSHG